MKKRIAIVFPNKHSSSETFIKSHVDHLPFEKRILYGGWFPTHKSDDKPLIRPQSKHILNRLWLRIKNRFVALTDDSRRNLALVNYLREQGIQAVLAEYGPTGVAIMQACQTAKIPLIVHFHGFDAYQFQTLNQYGVEYQEMFRRAFAIIAVSCDMRQQLFSLGAPSGKLYCNGYGIDLEKFHLNTMPVNEPRYLFVGRFVNKKGPHLLILAFERVRQVVPQAKLVMIGDGGLGNSGELFGACKQLVRTLDLVDSVEFLGSLAPESVAAEMKKAYAYAQHSVRADDGDSEGMPNSILEAISSGLPVVSTRHGGIGDIVVHGETGFLVEEYDIQSMASRLIELWKDKGLWQRMRINSRARAEEYFSLGRSIGALSEVIDRAVVGNV